MAQVDFYLMLGEKCLHFDLTPNDVSEQISNILKETGIDEFKASQSSSISNKQQIKEETFNSPKLGSYVTSSQFQNGNNINYNN